MNARTIQLILITFASLGTIAATDIFLPSLPKMASFFNSSENVAQLSIPLYSLGSLIGAPFFGTLSDKFTRRPIMLLGLSLFLIASLNCIFSTDMTHFVISRFFQGMGAIVVPVVGWAMVQDLYPKDESATIMAWVGGIISIGPMVAPMLGGYLDTEYGWQSSFVAITCISGLSLACMAFIRPALAITQKSHPHSLADTIQFYGQILSNTTFLRYVGLFGLLGAGEWCYITIMPFYFSKMIFLSPEAIGLYMTICASAYIIGTLLVPKVMSIVGLEKTLVIGSATSFSGVIFMLLVYLIAPTSALLISLAMGTYFIGASLIWGPSTSRALQCFEKTRGAASAVRGIILTGFFALGGFMGSLLDDTSLLPLTAFLLVTVLGTFYILVTLKSRRT